MNTNHKKRILDAFNFMKPDKIPVIYDESQSGVYAHGQKLLDLFNEFPPDNPIVFDKIPTPPPGGIRPDGTYHEIRKDDWGVEWEHSIFGMHGIITGYPFPSWEESTNYSFPKSGKPHWDDDVRRNYFIGAHWVSLFQLLCYLRPFEETLMDLQLDNPALADFIDRLVEYHAPSIKAHIDAGADWIMFGDDFGTQQAPMISPEIFRKHLKPGYEKLFKIVKQSGKKVVFHSCGRLGHILDELINLGIDGIWPQIFSPFQDGEPFFSKLRDARITLLTQPDQQYLMSYGSPRDIDDFVRDCSKRYHTAGGGGIFLCSIKCDQPFQNVEALVKAIDKYR